MLRRWEQAGFDKEAYMNISYHFGAPIFSVSLSVSGEDMRLSVGAVPHVPKHLESLKLLRETRIEGSPSEALSKICDGFLSLAGRFAGDDSDEGEFALKMLVAEDAPILRRKGIFIRIVDKSGQELAFRSESVIILEVIMALADQLASMANDVFVVARWAEIRSRCELFPFPRNNWGEDTNDNETTFAEGRWYASKLGQSYEYYRGAAVWLRARQHLFSFELVNVEPSAREYRVDFLLDLPEEDELMALVTEVCALSGAARQDFIADALNARNIDARQEVVYRRWYGDPAKRAAST